MAAVAASGGRRRASDRITGSKGRQTGGTAALEERLHSLYLGENVIPLPLLRASSVAALALKPYPELSEEPSWLQVLADVALESYSGAPGSRPDRAHAIPPAALQQVRVGDFPQKPHKRCLSPHCPCTAGSQQPRVAQPASCFGLPQTYGARGGDVARRAAGGSGPDP